MDIRQIMMSKACYQFAGFDALSDIEQVKIDHCKIRCQNLFLMLEKGELHYMNLLYKMCTVLLF